VLETAPLATEQTGTWTIGGTDMTTAWTGSGSIRGSNENDLVSSQSCFVSNHELELPKRPSVELRPLLSTATLTTITDAAEIFQHNQAIRGKTIDKAATNGMQVVACPTAFLIAQPCPSFFRSRAFALQDTPSGTEPLAPLNRFYTRNPNTVRSNEQVDFPKIDADDVLWRIAGFGDWNRNRDVQIEFTVPMTLENSRGGFRRPENWEIASSDFESALDPFPVASCDADPNFIAHSEQSEQTFIQVHRLCFESQQFHGLLFSFENFVRICNALTSTDGIISKEVEPLSDVVVGQVMQSDRIKASLIERDLTDSVACSSEHFERSFQTLFILYRQVQFSDNGQLHRTNYTTQTRICQEGGDWRHFSVV
jgi:hypothetical protein